jgi:hypothetical protein
MCHPALVSVPAASKDKFLRIHAILLLSARRDSLKKQWSAIINKAGTYYWCYEASK